jgi:hypothetical protein
VKGLRQKENMKNIQITFHPHTLIKGTRLYEQEAEKTGGVWVAV